MNHRAKDGSFIDPGHGFKRRIKKKLKKLDMDFHAKYFPGQNLFENEPPPEGRNVSWESFAKYVEQGSSHNFHSL